MTDGTFGISKKTWSVIELASAGLLAAVTARTTYKEMKKAGGLAKFVRPKGDAWKSASIYSSILISVILLKNAADAAKEYDIISGVGAASNDMQQRGLGAINYF
jgi:hypothetical protein